MYRHEDMCKEVTMGDPYTIRVFVPDGDPEGPKIVELLNWTGIGIAFPRAAWPRMNSRGEFKLSGVYVLIGSAEGTSDDLPTIYVGQGEEIRTRIDLHYSNKDFWDWCYAFVASGNALNRAHITWLEHALLERARNAKRCHLDNATQPKEPGLSESERSDTSGFLREMLRVLPLLGVRVFEKPTPVAIPDTTSTGTDQGDMRDTVIVPAQEEGFKNVFLGQNCWYAIRIGGGMLGKIKFIAAYQSSPISAVTHYAPVKRIEPYGDEGKYRLIFAEPAKEIPNPVPFGDATTGSMQGPRYTTLKKLIAAKSVSDLFM
jgi:hypothetical protein